LIRAGEESHGRSDKIPRRTGLAVPSPVRGKTRLPLSAPARYAPPSNLALVPFSLLPLARSPPRSPATPPAPPPPPTPPAPRNPCSVRTRPSLGRRQGTPHPPTPPSPWSPGAARPPRPRRPPLGALPPLNHASRCRPFASLYVPLRDSCSPLINPRFWGDGG
jgi:hypothetical protein